MADTPNIGYLLKQTQYLLHARMDEVLSPFELTVSQYSCLYRLSVDPGISAAGLARATFVTRQSMTTMLRSLVERGLVQRAARAEVGRALPAGLTARGTKLLERARSAVDEWEQRTLADLGSAREAALRDGLIAYSSSLGDDAAGR